MKKWPLPFPKPHPLPPKTFVKADGVKGGTASHALAAVPRRKVEEEGSVKASGCFICII